MYVCSLFFFFNDTATTEIYTLSLHDALPISDGDDGREQSEAHCGTPPNVGWELGASVAASVACELFHNSGQYRRRFSKRESDRKSTRLNSSHSQISYAVFCLKKKRPQ